MRDAGAACRAGHAVAERPFVMQGRLVGCAGVDGAAVEGHRDTPGGAGVGPRVRDRALILHADREAARRALAGQVSRHELAAVDGVVGEGVEGRGAERNATVREVPDEVQAGLAVVRRPGGEELNPRPLDTRIGSVWIDHRRLVVRQYRPQRYALCRRRQRDGCRISWPERGYREGVIEDLDDDLDPEAKLDRGRSNNRDRQPLAGWARR